jgi:hypothetical protein
MREVAMCRPVKTLCFGAIMLALFVLLAGQVVSAEEATVVFGVA